MYNPNCVRCHQARQGGYDGCPIHNTARRRYSVPTVVVVEHHHNHDYDYDYDYVPAGGRDVLDGDPVISIGGGFGVDVVTGDLEERVAPGVYVDADPSPGYSSYDGGGYDSSCNDY